MSGIDKMKNKCHELTGHAKQKIGKTTGDHKLQAQGRRDQASGNLEQAGEKVKDAFK